MDNTGTVYFFYEDTDFRLSNEATLKAWLAQCVAHYGTHQIEELRYIICSDTYLHAINQEYLQHDTFTDIITFDQSEQDELLEADIFISVDRIKENASQFNEPFNQELARVLAHGVLHLMGFNDKDEAQKAEMRKMEEACLSLLQQTL